MCFEERIHEQARLEGLPLGSARGSRCNLEGPRSKPMDKRYKRLLIALAAVASLYLVKATGLDKGLIDEVMNSAVEALVVEDEQPQPEVAQPQIEVVPEGEEQ